jgi:hypothetical protein
MHANSVLLTQDGINMAMSKKKTAIKKTATKKTVIKKSTAPKKKIGKDLSDVIDYVKRGGRDAEASYDSKKQIFTVHTPSKEGPYNLSTKVTKQGKSGWSSVVHRNATFTNQDKDFGKRGHMAPISNPEKALGAIQDLARQDDKRNRLRNSSKNKKKK